MALTEAEHEPDQSKSNTTAGLWSEDSAGRNLGPSAQQELLQVSRLRNQDHAGGAFIASQNPRAMLHHSGACDSLQSASSGQKSFKVHHGAPLSKSDATFNSF